MWLKDSISSGSGPKNLRPSARKSFLLLARMQVTRMRVSRMLTLAVAIVLVAANSTLAAGVARKLIEARTYDHGWEADMAALDLLSNALHEEAATTGYIIIYGARRGRRGEAERRMQCMRRYLIDRRGISASRMKVIHGGYRQSSMFELWVVPAGDPAPISTPTLGSKDANLRKGRIRYSCDN
jgi:hypothetical protein